MTLPSQTFTVLDPGLGAVTPSADSPLYSGPAAGGAGVVNTVYSFSRQNDIRATLGYGQLSEDVALALQERGGPVLAQITAGTTAATTSAVTKGNGASPTVSITGTPRDLYTARIEIMATGVLGTGTFRYTLDRHSVTTTVTPNPTWSAVRTIPAGGTFVMGSSGLTATFAAGTYTLGDTFSFGTTQAQANSTDLGTAALVIIGLTSLQFPYWIVSGSAATAAAASAIAVALSGHLTTLAGGFRFARGIVDAGSGDTATNVKAERANWSSKRINADYGYCLSASVLPYEGFAVRKTSAASVVASRANDVLVSTDIARFAEGALGSVSGIDFDSTNDATVDNLQLGTLRTWPGIAGFYVGKARLASNPPSDFTDLHFGRIMDLTCRTVYEAQLPFQVEGFRTVASPVGAIDPLDKADVEKAVLAALSAKLLQPKNARGRAGHVSAVSYSVDGTNNLNATGQILTTTAVRPLGYANEIIAQLGFAINV
jgi:hypothetical protein